MVRLTPHLNAWQFLVFRGAGVACAFALLWRLKNKSSVLVALARLGRTGFAVSIVLGVSAISFIFALKLTTVANALFLSSCSPLLSAILGYFVLGERLSALQLASVGLGFVGLAIIVGGGLDLGNMLGNANALVSALGFASGGVLMRRAGQRDFVPAIFGYGLVCALTAMIAIVSLGGALMPSVAEAFVGFAAGFVLMGLGFVFFLRGAVHVPAVGQTVLAQTETAFGPLWVWLFLGERATLATLVGGAVILVAVVAMALSGAPPVAPNASN